MVIGQIGRKQSNYQKRLTIGGLLLYLLLLFVARIKVLQVKSLL